MQVFVGTSGWAYPWNLGGNLEWYRKHSGLNAVELNASFYRFPYPNQIKGWKKQGEGLRFAIKIHRLISHRHRLGEEAREIWDRFRELFQTLDPLIDFYLLQLPPNFQNLTRVRQFALATGLRERLAVEFRHKELLRPKELPELEGCGITLVSTDSPLGENQLIPGRILYLRLHGRKHWYDYDYSLSDLRQLVREIEKLNPQKAYIFFNNDQAMLKNARTFLRLFSTALRSH